MENRREAKLMIHLLGFDANNKIIISTQPRIAQESIY
jgi:hypothetical protein